MKNVFKAGLGGPRYFQALLVLILLTAVFTFSPARAAVGANGGGGGSLTRGSKPTIDEIKKYMAGWAAIRVLGYLYSQDKEKTPTMNPTLLAMAGKISKGLTVEMRTSGPCLNAFKESSIASIYSDVADICFNPNTFIEQKEMPVNRRTFELHLDGLMAHEILHLVQRDHHEKITVQDEEEANTFQEKYLDAAESGQRPVDLKFASLATYAAAVLKISKLTSKPEANDIGFKVAGASNEEAIKLCSLAHNYELYVEPLVLYSTSVIVNNVHLVSMDSDYWLRDDWMWRAAFKSRAEQDFITRRPRGRGDQSTPSFVQIAQMLTGYHCKNSSAFSNYREQTFRSKEEMYNEYRDLMLAQVDFVAQKTLEVFAARFKIDGDGPSK
jgi:hypothetical protein